MVSKGSDSAETSGRGGRGGRGSGFAGGGASAASQTVPGLTVDPTSAKTRVVVQFPANATDMLLSGTLEGGNTLVNRAQVVDESIGQGHLVMFAIRPFWRWQTQGTFAMGFNAILNWNDLDAGRAQKAATDR
jgi:hypothetical protein